MSRDTVISGAWELGRQASPEHPPSIPRASPEHPRSLPMGARIHRNKTNKPTGEGARNENGGHWVSHVSPVARGVAKGVARGVARGVAKALSPRCRAIIILSHSIVFSTGPNFSFIPFPVTSQMRHKGVRKGVRKASGRREATAGKWHWIAAWISGARSTLGSTNSTEGATGPALPLRWRCRRTVHSPPAQGGGKREGVRRQPGGGGRIG